jgi:ankyrin repeat protein
VLVVAGAEVNARSPPLHTGAPLHWAASSDDVEVLDALLDAGADIEAPGAVIGGGTPLDDAVAFGQWNAARRLVERGASLRVWHAAALGRLDVLRDRFAAGEPPGRDDVTEAFWAACHGGQREAAQYLLDRGADRDWVGYDGLTPLDVARRSGARDVADWLEAEGAASAQASS